jgi:sialic acid synthase SpsE
MSKTFIIAEAGANHNKDWQMAKELIDVAVESGADAVKFQTYSSETLYSKYTPDFAGYKNIPKLIKDIELPRSWQRDLKLYCDDVGIEFMSTPFDEQAVEELVDIGAKRLKIAGFEATDPRWVRFVASTGLPIIISLGTGTTHDTILKIHNLFMTSGQSSSPDVTYLHCNSAYPTPFEDINLGNLALMRNLIDQQEQYFENTKIGLSDHTEGILVPPLAVALGAQVIEKHYTLSRKLEGPDHPFAIEPHELKDMVTNIRTAEMCLDTKKDVYTKSEVGFSKARRSVVARGDIPAGTIISERHITTKRPLLGDSVSAELYYKILGSQTTVDIKEDEILKWEMILAK